jgi:nicotinate-nucleotide adenylyltransferase
MVDLIVARRNGGEVREITFPCTYIENRLLPLSSSEIRERIRTSRSIRYLVPPGVIGYIEQHGLYRFG